MSVAKQSFIFSDDARTGAPTLEEIKKRRALVDAMAARQGIRPVNNVVDGLTVLGEGLLQRWARNKLDAQEKELTTQANADRDAAIASYGQFDPSPRAGASIGTAPMMTESERTGEPGGSSTSAPGGSLYSDFIGGVQEAGLTNPYGLAAVASTGRAESGYQEANAYGSWSDPSQSGQPGTAGGIMSWRADRLDNLRSYAAANGGDPNRISPALQAKFFASEDPALFASLQNARSLEEAQGAMNKAWAFAGHDEPGGAEVQRRLAYAQSYLPSFQGGGRGGAGGGVQVASLDPSAGMGSMPPAPGGAPSYLRYANEGATRSQPLSGELTGALGFLGDMGITAEVFSGGQSSAQEGGPRTGSTRHDHGNAADVRFYTSDGRQLDWSNPEDVPTFQEIVRRGRAAGLSGFGAGGGYMGQGTMHVGFGTPGVWGAGGRSANAPGWLREAFEGSAPAGGSSAPGGGVQVASLDPSIGMGTTAYAPQQSPRDGLAAILAAVQPNSATATPDALAPLPEPVDVGSYNLPVPTARDPWAGMREIDVQPSQSDGLVRLADASGSMIPAGVGPVADAGQPRTPGQILMEDYGLTPEMMRAMSNPNLSPQGRALLQIMVERRQKDMAEASRRAYEEEKDRLRRRNELEDYQRRKEIDQRFAEPTQFRTIGPDEAGAMGLPRGTYQVGPDERLYPMDDGQPEAPSGYRYSEGGNLEFIPGGPHDPSRNPPKRDLVTIYDEQGREQKGYYDEKGVFVPQGGPKASSNGSGITVSPDGTVTIGGKLPLGYMPDPNDPSRITPIPGGPGEQIAGELAARVGLADEFLKKAPALRERLSAGEASGPYDVFQARNNQSSPQAQVHRELEFGVEALVRLLTGAGMNMAEATERTRRYLPTYTDDAASMVSKLDELTDYLRSTKDMAMRGRGGSSPRQPGEAAPSASENDPLGIR